MNAAVRPIHLPGAAALDSLRQRAQTVFDAWAREWISGWTTNEHVTALQVDAISNAAMDGRHVHEYEALRGAAGDIWLRRNAADRLNFARAVMGVDDADEWAADAVQMAWNSGTHALCSALLGTSAAATTHTPASALPESLFALGSGAVRLSCESIGLHAIVDSAVWRSVPPGERKYAPRPKLTALDQATRRAQLHLDVMLGSVEIELPKLLDLRCGDVLRLPQRLDQGIAVLCEGKPLARAALGEAQGRKCVQIDNPPSQ